MKHFVQILLFLIIFIPAQHIEARGKTQSTGLIPATPPVKVHTQNRSVNYHGFGYLNFNVSLPVYATPEFTLGSDEDARWKIGNVEHKSQGLVYVNDGKLRRNKSVENSWIVGKIDSKIKENTFTRDGVLFRVDYSRSGYYFGKRDTTAKRLVNTDFATLDYAYSFMYAAFYLSGNTRIESASAGKGNYISDWDESTTGFIFRPMITLQPTFHLGSHVNFIPFIGASTFMNANYSSWEVNQWEDELYGPDCFDGCGDADLFFDIIPVETYFGFDIEFKLSDDSVLSLASFFSNRNTTDTKSMSEVYVVYTLRL